MKEYRYPQLRPYLTPDVQVIDLVSEKVLCGSPDGSTESYSRGGEYSESDFD